MKLLLFVSSHCPHCPKAASMVKRVLRDYKNEDVSFRKLRTKTADGKRLADEYGVTATPTLFVISNGKQDKIIGVPDEGKLRKKLDKGLGIKRPFLKSLKETFFGS